MYSHWLGPEPGPGQWLGPGRIGCMVLRRTFHTSPEQGQGRTPGTFSGPEEWVWYPFFRSWKCIWWWILVFFPVPAQVQCERFFLKPYNPFFPVRVQCDTFCIIPVSVPVLVPVPDQASVNTPRDKDEWVVWVYVEPFILQLNRDRGDTVLSPGTGQSQCGYTIYVIFKTWVTMRCASSVTFSKASPCN